uniref:Zinc finger protein n=1 Tax=Loa loa TaxID=7209 RepID=A0A1I7W5K5_LOALO
MLQPTIIHDSRNEFRRRHSNNAAMNASTRINTIATDQISESTVTMVSIIAKPRRHVKDA